VKWETGFDIELARGEFRPSALVSYPNGCDILYLHTVKLSLLNCNKIRAGGVA